MSCVVMRMRLPARRTLPCSTVATWSCSPTTRSSCCLPLNENADMRAATCRPSTRDSALMMSSAIPSPKYSFCLSSLKFTNGSTAIDCAGAAIGATTGIESIAVSSACHSAAEPGRSIGVRLSARCKARATGLGTPSRNAVISAGVWTNRLAMTACTVGPVNGGSPTSISYNTQPNEYRSLRPSMASPTACSGLMYAGVPMLVPACVSVSAPESLTAFPMPKSATSAWPSCSMMFSGLMSRWMTS